LDDNRRRKFSLISAPAGFGKTTLLSDWIDGLELPVAWLSLDRGDDDPVRLLAYLTAALRTLDADLGTGTLRLLDSPQQPPLEALTTALINDIAARPESFILILDDCHHIEAQSAYDLVDFILERMPDNLHIVMSGRVDPPLPLAHLRAQGHLMEVRASDLRFDSREVTEFLNDLMELGLTDDDLQALEARTEGWIAGLQLAALSLQRRDDDEKREFIKSFSGSHRFIMDYLGDEVMSHQTVGTQDFLCRTSILDRFCAPLCDELLEISTSRQTLARLERDNLFLIALDDERLWYRYHHLFADYLRLRLDVTEPERVQELHRRASAWYRHNGYAEEAAEQALSGKEYGLAAELLEDLAETYWRRGQPSTLTRWMERLPRAHIESRPGLSIHYAWVLRLNGNNLAAEKMLVAAERALRVGKGDLSVDDSGMLSGDNQRELQARVAAIRASIAFWKADTTTTHTYAQEALDLFPDESSMWRSLAAMTLGMAQDMAGDTVAACQTVSKAVEYSRASANTYLILSTSLHLGALLITRGELKQANELLQEIRYFAEEQGVLNTEMSGCMFDELGLVQCEWNNIDRSREYLERGSALSEQGFDVGVLGYSYLTTIRDLFSRGELQTAQDVIQKMDRLENITNVPAWYSNQKEAWKARIWLEIGDLESAARWARIRELTAETESYYLMENEYISVARVLIAEQKYEDASTLLERILASAMDGGRNANAGQILFLMAQARNSMGNPEGALQALSEALELTEPGGYIRAYLDEGLEMHELLREAASRDISPEYVRTLLAAFEVEGMDETPSISPALLPEPLTDRELQILRLLATDLSGPEIANELSVSENTMRTHTRSIYGKLDAHSRRQALSIAEDLELI
jgi:LuxR family maltose regulon positive regulatory protein